MKNNRKEAILQIVRNARLVALAVIGLMFTYEAIADELSPEAYANFIRQVEEHEKARTALPVELRKLQGELLDFSQTDDNIRKVQTSSKEGADVRKECQITCIVSDRLAELIAELGGEVTCRSERDNVITALLPASALSVIATDKDVWNIYAVEKAITNENVSEGVVAHKVNSARSDYGVTGNNVKVGVISDSADTYGEYGNYSGLVGKLQNSGDLPRNVTVVGDTYGTGEGSGMMEIVYDLAPGASLFFKNGSNTEVGFANDIELLMQQGCRVIVDDLTLGREAAFEGGVIGRKIKEFVEKGGVYFSSAANSGAIDRGSSCTWEGDYKNGDNASNLGGNFHDFGNSKANRITSVGTGRIKLWWSDPWGKSSNDYNLYVIDSNGNVLQQSVDSQNGNGCYPFEIITLTPSTASKVQSGLYVVVVKKSGAQARYLRLEVTRGGLGMATCGSAYGHNAGEDVISCAAASASGFSRAFKSADPLENYSSDGPRHIFYTTTGTAITAGNLLSTGGRILQKPDFTAADNTLSAWTATAFGYKTFGGTSAAAPHAAAIAALMLEANPNLTQTDIIEILKKSTFSGTNATWNRNYGYGIIDAHTAVKFAKESVASKIGLAPATQSFTASANDGMISVTAASSWTATTSDSWIILKTQNGNGNGSILYSVEANAGTSERTGVIIVTSGTDKAMHSVRQAAASAQLNINPTVSDFSDTKSDGQFSVSANLSWTATASASWIILNKTMGDGNGSVLYSVEANMGSRRTGTITVTSGSLTATHTVTQAAQPQLSIDPSVNNCTAAASQGSFRVTSDSMWTVTTSATWIKLNTDRGSGNGTVTYSIDENTGNSRQGFIYVTSGSVKSTHMVVQTRMEGITFVPSSQSVNVSGSGDTGTFTFTVMGNTRIVSLGYSQVDWASWSFSREDITEGEIYTCAYTVQANTTQGTRSVKIPITFNGEEYDFTITQGIEINNYVVTYKPGANGTGSETYDLKRKNVSLTLRGAIFTRTDGYEQTGWATSDGGGRVYDLGASYTANAAITLYPYWTKKNVVEETYNIYLGPGSYGDGKEQTLVKTKGVALTLPGALYTRDGYEQTGWSQAISGSSKAYDLGGKYTKDVMTYLYPYWTKVTEEEPTESDFGFYLPSGWNNPIYLCTTNTEWWTYAPQYLFSQGDSLRVNYCINNYSETQTVNVNSRLISLISSDGETVTSLSESFEGDIQPLYRKHYRSANVNGWLSQCAPGNYAIKMTLDPFDELNDVNQSDNTAVQWFAVKAEGITLNEALDCSSLNFTDNGTTAFPQTSESVVGGSCVQLGPQPTNSLNSSVLWVHVTEPGTLMFKWKATSQDGYKAYLGCYVNGNLAKYKWATEHTEWEEAFVTIDTAPLWVCWRLGTNEPEASYLTAGWVDCVTWSGDAKKPTFTVDSSGKLTGIELNGVTDLEIPSMVNSIPVRSIGAYVLTNTAITSVSIPTSVTNIDDFAFYNNPHLTGVSIPGSVLSIGESAFNACGSLKSVVLNEGVTTIGNYAFYNCGSLSIVTLPASLTSIGQSPFGKCCNLNTISVAPGNWYYFVENNALIAMATRTLVQYPSGRRESEYEVPEGLFEIGYDAFDTVTNLTKITIPASVTALGSFAFFQCQSLQTIVFKGNAPSVGDYAFYGVASSCKALVSPQSSGWGVSIPGTWQGIGIEYSAALQTYDVTYSPGIYGIGSQMSEVKSYGITLPLKGAIFTRIGYSQTGWSTSDGGAKVYELGASYTTNAAVTLYPYWEANTYGVAYELDGGEAGADAPSSADYGTAFCVSAPTRDGYVFMGWMVTVGLDITTARYGESVSNQSTEIGNASQQCFNGSDVDVWFINLTPVADGNVTLTATWEPVPDDSRDIGFYAPASKGWSFPVCLSSTNINYLAYAPETEFVQFSDVFLSFCAVNWSTAGSAMLQSTLLTITDESGAVFDQGEPILVKSLGAFGYAEVRNLSMRRYMSGITPGHYRLTLELDPNRLLVDPDLSNNITSIWFTVVAPIDPIPELPSDATAADVRVALADSVDGRLAENISDVPTYTAYREWAHGAKGADGNPAGVESVKSSNKAWFSFAVDSSELIEKEIVGDDVKIEDFAMASDGGQFDFTVGITDVTIGDGATTARLKTIFGVEGATKLEDSAFSTDNLTLETAEPEFGKVKLTVKPPAPKTSEEDSHSVFFMRVKVND